MDERHIYAVSSISKREFLVKKIRENLLSHITPPLKVIQPQVNKIQIVHRIADDNWMVIKTYLIIVIPLIIDTSPLIGAVVGNYTYHLGGIIKELEDKIKSLQLLAGQHTTKETHNETYRGLARSLSTLHEQDRTSSYL